MVDRVSEYTRPDERLAYGLGQSFARNIASRLPLPVILEEGTAATVLNPADQAYATLTGEDPLRHLGTVHRIGAGDTINEILDASEKGTE